MGEVCVGGGDIHSVRHCPPFPQKKTRQTINNKLELHHAEIN